MSKQIATLHRLKVVSIVEMALIAFMFGIILYLLQYVRQGSTVTLMPTLTSSAHATTLPNATSAPTIDMQVPAVQNKAIEPAFQRV